jgi:predicted dienelactone hydrolase
VLTDANGKNTPWAWNYCKSLRVVVTQVDHDIATMELTDSYNAKFVVVIGHV